jgi:putative DNA primase/helicase
MPNNLLQLQNYNPANYEAEFRESMSEAGVNYNGPILADGQIHRFANDSKGNRDCWYVFYGMAGAFGDWRTDTKEKWSINTASLTDSEKKAIQNQIALSKKAFEKEIARKHAETAIDAQQQWEALCEEGSSPYLTKKQVDAFGIRYRKESLVIPLRDIEGKLWSLQTIFPDGTKRFLKSGRIDGCFHLMGHIEDEKPVFITEGYATGASVHMATH